MFLCLLLLKSGLEYLAAAKFCFCLLEKSRVGAMPGVGEWAWRREKTSPFIVFSMEIICLEPLISWLDRVSIPCICGGPTAQLSPAVLFFSGHCAPPPALGFSSAPYPGFPRPPCRAQDSWSPLADVRTSSSIVLSHKGHSSKGLAYL